MSSLRLRGVGRLELHSYAAINGGGFGSGYRIVSGWTETSGGFSVTGPRGNGQNGPSGDGTGCCDKPATIYISMGPDQSISP